MTYSGRVSEAFAYAMVLHGEQKRKGTDVPYITHLMGVASLVGEQGGDEDLVIAALLHDAVEDQGGKETLCTIRKRFGERVARVVEACSDRRGLTSGAGSSGRTQGRSTWPRWPRSI